MPATLLDSQLDALELSDDEEDGMLETFRGGEEDERSHADAAVAVGAHLSLLCWPST
jgi:hypothetical protein